MEVLKTERILCPCCMAEHDVKTVRILEDNVFKGNLSNIWSSIRIANVQVIPLKRKTSSHLISWP